MPELPEVEAIKNEVSPWVVGQSFTQVTIFDAKLMPEAVELCVLLKTNIKLGGNWGEVG